jgi:hypothetical protein
VDGSQGQWSGEPIVVHWRVYLYAHRARYQDCHYTGEPQPEREPQERHRRPPGGPGPHPLPHPVPPIEPPIGGPQQPLTNLGGLAPTIDHRLPISGLPRRSAPARRRRRARHRGPNAPVGTPGGKVAPVEVPPREQFRRGSRDSSTTGGRGGHSAPGCRSGSGSSPWRSGPPQRPGGGLHSMI